MGNSILKQLYKDYEPILKRHSGSGVYKYVTHDNGARSFMVYVHSKRIDGKVSSTDVWVYKNTIGNNNLRTQEAGVLLRGIHEESPIMFTDFALHIPSPKRVFVGHSPKNEMTEYSGAFGPEFMGNTMLVQKKDLDYVCIGGDIFEFTALDEIVEYVSPVGNNLVPYPYAVDKKGRHYNMLHEACIPTGSGYTAWKPERDNPYPTRPPELTRCMEIFNKVPKKHRKDPYDWFHYLKDGAFPWLSRADTLVPIRPIHGRVM